MSYCNFVEHSIERVPQEKLWQHIEKCGRVCYKSEDKMTDESAQKFIDNLRKREHNSVLEHGTIYLIVPRPVDNSEFGMELYLNLIEHYKHNHWSRIHIEPDKVYITTNFRVLVENGWEDDLVFRVEEPTEYHRKRVTFKFVHDVGIARDSNRHRAHSISEESTRFINYNRKGVTFTASPFTPEECADWDDTRTPMVFENMWFGTHDDEITDLDVWLFSCYTSTYCYNKLINLGWSPQMARRALNFGVKTETYYTAFVDDWVEYIRKREHAHPDLKALVRQMIELLKHEIPEDVYLKYSQLYKECI